MTAANKPGPITCLDDTGLKITTALYKAIATLTTDPCLLATIGSWGDTLDDADVLDGLRRWIEMGECFIPEVAAPVGLATKPQCGPYDNLIGQVLDAWDSLMNDQRSAIKGEAPEFVHWILMLRSAADSQNPTHLAPQDDERCEHGIELHQDCFRCDEGRAAMKPDGGCMADVSPDDPKTLRELLAEPSVFKPSPAGPADVGVVKLGRFNHHPDPAIDFCIEVEVIEAEWSNIRHGFTNGTPSRSEIASRVAIAMQFRVGGDPQAVAAKDTLRGIEKELLAPVGDPVAWMRNGPEGDTVAFVQCDEDDEGAFPVYRSTPPAPAGEPFGYAVLADNGNVRVWWRDKKSADAHEQLTGAKPAAVYTVQPAPVGEPVAQKYDDTLVPFVALMRAELHANSGKGDRPGWLQMDRKTGLLEIFYHLAKLQKAVKDNDPERIREFGADVANMAMMLVDICGALPLYTAPPSVSVEEVARNFVAYLNESIAKAAELQKNAYASCNDRKGEKYHGISCALYETKLEFIGRLAIHAPSLLQQSKPRS